MLNGDAETACSVIELSTGKFDQGQILYQVKVGVEPEENAEDLRARLSAIGADAIAHAILQFEDLRSTAIRQADTGYQTSSAPKLKKVISDLDFEQLSKKEVYRIYRAVGHSFPLRVLWNGEQPLMLKKLAPENTPIPTFSADARAAAAPGDVLFHPASKLVYVLCGDGEWVGVSNLMFPTKKVLNAAAFANGYSVRKQGGRFAAVDATR